MSQFTVLEYQLQLGFLAGKNPTEVGTLTPLAEITIRAWVISSSTLRRLWYPPRRSPARRVVSESHRRAQSRGDDALPAARESASEFLRRASLVADGR